MTKQELTDRVLTVFSDYFKKAQDIDFGSPPTTGTDPIKHLGLDSLSGVEVVLCLEENLPFSLPYDLNMFVEYPKGRKKRSRTIGEFVDELLEIQRNQEEGK